MPRYNYKCTNTSCREVNVLVTINKPMSEVSNVERCKECSAELKRDYSGIGAIKTGDGIKS